MFKNLLVFFILVTLTVPILCFGAKSIDINTATLEQLQEITEVGPKRAQAIIDARPFSSVDDLIRVKGIKEKTLKKIKDQGLACVNCQTSLTTQTADEKTKTTETKKSTEQSRPGTIYPSGIFINEILPNPDGPDETNEWIELYNSNNFDVNLSGWIIKDMTGTIKTFIIPKDTQILANGFLVFKRPNTKIMLNNDKDGLTLIAPNNEIIDSTMYNKAPLGQSYNKINSNWRWSAIPTPRAENIVVIESNDASRSLSKSEKSDKNNNEYLTANLIQGVNQSNNPWLLFFTALTITIISSAAVLLIKFKLKSKN